MLDLLTDLEQENENKTIDLSIEQKIECPRCRGVMSLHVKFDSPGYFCEECDFVLRMAHSQ